MCRNRCCRCGCNANFGYSNMCGNKNLINTILYSILINQLINNNGCSCRVSPYAMYE